MLRAGKNTITNLKLVSWARGWTSSDYTPQGWTQNQPLGSRKAPRRSLHPHAPRREPWPSCRVLPSLSRDNSQLPKLPCLPGPAVLAPHLEGHSRIAPKGHGSCHFRSLKLGLNPRPGFLHGSCVNLHLLKSSFPIQGKWTAQWKKMQLLCCWIQVSICV